MIFIKKILPLSFLLFLFSCGNENHSPTPAKNPLVVQAKNTADPFQEYWYQGKAEITSYDLQQARYGEMREGSAVLVFVTEDFSKKNQVKLDHPSRHPKDVVPVLKLNMTRKFNTGIYPYSMMMSSFTPVDLIEFPNTLKVTNSSQEWCGHTFMQLNLKKYSYESQLFSYFESEGDNTTRLERTFVEDELWSKIRIDPKHLPQGKIDIIPGTTYARLKHIDFKNEKATASLKEKGAEMHFHLVYKNLDRKLSIVFEKAFPHQIISWEESYKDGYGSRAKTMTTKATRKKSILLDYWSKNGNEDASYRKELGLE
jgi:hypothetical protein